MVFQIQLNKEDIEDFCDICTQLKASGVYVEVAQDNKVISGSSIIGLMLIDFDKPAHIITRVKVEHDAVQKLSRWIL